MSDKPKVRVNAYYDVMTKKPFFWEAMAEFGTHEALAEALPKIPKSAGLKEMHPIGHGTKAYARGNLRPTDVTGEVNEAGIRRYRTVLRSAAKIGADVEWEGPESPTQNRYLNQKQFHQAIGEPSE